MHGEFGCSDRSVTGAGRAASLSRARAVSSCCGRPVHSPPAAREESRKTPAETSYSSRSSDSSSRWQAEGSLAVPPPLLGCGAVSQTELEGELGQLPLEPRAALESRAALRNSCPSCHIRPSACQEGTRPDRRNLSQFDVDWTIWFERNKVYDINLVIFDNLFVLIYWFTYKL